MALLLRVSLNYPQKLAKLLYISVLIIIIAIIIDFHALLNNGTIYGVLLNLPRAGLPNFVPNLERGAMK
jgi:hypothetical protein